MLHAPARVARSSRPTGAVWAMMVLVDGGERKWWGGPEDVQEARGGRQECTRLFVWLVVVGHRLVASA